MKINIYFDDSSKSLYLSHQNMSIIVSRKLLDIELGQQCPTIVTHSELGAILFRFRYLIFYPFSVF